MDSPMLWRLLAALRATRDEEGLFGLLEEATYFLGFQQFALMHHVDLGRSQDATISLTNYDPLWAAMAINPPFSGADPFEAASVRRVAAFSWSEIPTLIDMSERQRNFFRKARAFGLVEGMTVPIHVPGEYQGTCSFGGRWRLNIHRNALPMGHLIGTYAFETARRIMRTRAGDQDHRPGRPRLTQRQQDVLVELGRGKSDAEIAAILGISSFTAHEHVEAIRFAYGGAQRPYLIGRALFDGQLSFLDILRRR
jgi:LuxR family quorum-sensing system transcriptional regulator CciR